MNRHRIVQVAVALSAGILLATYAYQRAIDPVPTLERQQEEAVVRRARQILRDYVAVTPNLEVVDPLAKNRAAGNVYIYPTDKGWQVSGHYRHERGDPWNPWLMALDEQSVLTSLKVRDRHPEIRARARDDGRFEVDTP